MFLKVLQVFLKDLQVFLKDLQVFSRCFWRFSRCPPGVLQVSSSCGPGVVQVWSRCGPGVVQVSDESCPPQTRSMDPQVLERAGGRLLCGDVCMEPFMADFRGSCSPAECLGRTSIGPLSESDEECREDEEEEEEEEEVEERDAQTAVFERDCTELDLNLIEEN